MSGGIPDIAGTGYLPLRHEQPNVDIGLRHVVNAVALQEVDPATPGIWKEVPGSAGDVLGAFFWLPEEGRRSGAGWSFSSWPVKVSTPDKSGAVTVIRNQSGTKVRPIRTEKIDADERFEEKSPALPAWASKSPKGWPGLVTGATNEDKQELIFTPGFHGLVAAEAAGDPDLSTVLLDLDGDDRPDGERKAHLNAFWRVVKKPVTSPSIGAENGIAWQLGTGRGARAGYGLITGAGVAQAGGPAPSGGDGRIDTGIDLTDEPAAPGASATGSSVPWTIGSVSGGPGADTQQSAPVAVGGARHACMSVFAGGPIAIPGPDDAQHKLGTDADGNDIMAAAIHTTALFMGPEQGQVGPIAFERGPMPALQAGNYLTPVHIRFDPSLPHTWSAAGRPGAGMWRAFAESHFYVPPVTTPPQTTPPETTPPVTTPPVTTPKKKKKRPPTTSPPPTTPPPPPTTPGGEGGGTPVIPTSFGPFPPRPPETPPGGGITPPAGETGTPVVPGGQVTPPTPPGGDRPENPPPRPGGVPSGEIDGPTGLPPHLPKETPGGQNEKTKPRKGDLPNPVRPGESSEPGLPEEGWIDPAGELDATPPEYDPRRDGPLGPDGIPKRRLTGGTRREEIALPFVATHMELAVPALLFRAGTCSANKADLQNTPRPAENDVGEHDKTAPVVARVEAAFAKPGANCGSALPSYTSAPGASRYCGGTANGVVGHFPAEVGMRDHASDFAPPGVNVSTVHHTYLKGKVFHGSGLPDPTLALTKSGYTWGVNATTGAMEFHERSSTGAITSTNTLPKRTGTVVQAPSALSANYIPRADANGDLVVSAVSDDGTNVLAARDGLVIGVAQDVQLSSSGAGLLKISDYTGGTGASLIFAAATSGHPRLRANSNTLETKLGDNSGYAKHVANVLESKVATGTAPLIVASTTVVANLNADTVDGYEGAALATPADNVFRIVGSGDATKKLAFEVDGITTGTTRTLTAPNRDGTVMLGGGSLGLGEIPEGDSNGDITGSSLLTVDVQRLYIPTSQTASSGGNYAVAANIGTAFVDGSALTAGQNYDVTLPSAATYSGRRVTVKISTVGAATSTVTVKSSGGTVEGVAAATGVPMDGAARTKVTYQSDGTNWWSV